MESVGSGGSKVTPRSGAVRREPDAGTLESAVAGALTRGNLQHNWEVSSMGTCSRAPGVPRMVHQGEKTFTTFTLPYYSGIAL